MGKFEGILIGGIILSSTKPIFLSFERVVRLEVVEEEAEEEAEEAVEAVEEEVEEEVEGGGGAIWFKVVFQMHFKQHKSGSEKQKEQTCFEQFL